MGDVLYFNGRFTTTDERCVSVEDRGFQFADGIYEVLKFVNKRAAFILDHYRRLTNSCSALEFPVPFTADEFTTFCSEMLARTAFDGGILYLQVTRGESARTHFYAEDLMPTVVAYTRAFTFPTAAKKEIGIRVITTPDDRWQRCNIKTIGLLANALAKKKAQRAGAEEALFIGDEKIREGASSNFFIVEGDRIVTHPTGANVLEGVVRNQVITLALANRIRVDERPIHENELPSIEEAFITNTTGGVMPVSEIDGRIIGNGRRGPITEQLQRLFDAREAMECGGVR